jgi:FkbM family methyltransferase
MLITVAELVSDWGINPNGVIHVGAHLGEEAKDYELSGWLPVTWIEAQPILVSQLQSILIAPLHRVIEGAVWEIDDLKMKFHVASNSQSSSLLDFGSHSQSHPDILYVDEIEVTTKRIDSIIEFGDMPNFLNLDIQGVELPAIKSLGKLIDKVDFIFTEVNRKEVYKDCTQVSDLDNYLSQQGFSRELTRWIMTEGWGDALYIRTRKILKRNLHQILRSHLRQLYFYLRQCASFIKRLLFRI